MAQVDLVSASATTTSDGNIAFDDLPDFAPASFFLSKDAELDWLDRNAFIERKDSGKGASLIHSTPNPCSSNRYHLSVKSKPSFIGLPKASYGEPIKPRRPPSIRLFPKRPKSNSGRKSSSDALVADPSSPKVSCIGRVRSRRDRSLRKKNRPQKQQLPDPPMMISSSIRRSRSHKAGFWSNFLSIFGSRGHSRRPEVDGDEPAAAGKLNKSRSSRRKRSLGKSKSLRKRTSGSSPSSADPPTLVAVRQFTSGRRSDAWAADLEAVDGATTKLE